MTAERKKTGGGPTREKPEFDWSRRRVFVTGCAGFLGSHLADDLVGRGATVVGLVRDAAPESVRSRVVWDSSRIVEVRGSLEDVLLLERAVNEHEIDTVFHLGAQAIVPIARRAPLSTFESNVRGTWCLLEACRRVGGVERIVVASSDKAYGESAHGPSREDEPLRGTHPYDASKACAEIVSRSFRATFNVPVAVTRCGNLYGGRDLNWNRLVPGTIRSVLEGRPPVVRSDGSPVRDWFFVGDAVDAYRLLAERLGSDGLAGEIFNFSNEDPRSVLDVVRRLLAMLSSSLEPVIENSADAEIRVQCLSAEKARTRLGWRPARSLDEGLSATVEWYREFLTGGPSAGGAP